MYLSMKSIGYENEEKIKTIETESGRWQFLYDTAKKFGFEGVQFNAVDKTGYSIDIKNIPDYFTDLRITLHFDNNHKIMSRQEYDTFNRELNGGFEIAAKHNMHDISLHPPVKVNGFTADEKKLYEEWFDKTTSRWVKEARRSNITLSMETHVYGGAFLFDGLPDFARFIDKHPDLGVLIDISHNYQIGFSENDIINILGDKNIIGLHISDALQNVDVAKGTHLIVGEGKMDFAKILKHFSKFPNIYGALEIRANNDGIAKSLNRLKRILYEN